MPQGHPDYRFICPALTDAGNFIDWEKYRWAAAVGDEDGVQEVGIRKRKNKLNGEGFSALRLGRWR